MYCLQVKFPSGREFLEHSFECAPAGGIYVSHRLGLKVSDQIWTEVDFPSLAEPVFLFGKVTRMGLHMLHGGKQKRCSEIRFHKEEVKVREAMVNIALNDLEDFQIRQNSREQVALNLNIWNHRSNENLKNLVTDDLSPGGTFVPSTVLFPVGTLVNLDFCISGYSGRILTSGEVAHHGLRRQGGRRGMGIRFCMDEVMESRKMRAFYKRIAQSSNPSVAKSPPLVSV